MKWDPTQLYQNEDVAEGYDAERFSRLSGRIFNSMEKRLIVNAFSDLPAGSLIADIPCGTGRLAEPLLEAGFSVHGMDISDEMLSVARRRLQRFGASFTTEVADARELKPRPEPFEGALCARVLMHFSMNEQIAFLKGVTTLASTRVVLTQSYDSSYQRLRRKLKKLLGHQPPAQYPVDNADIDVLLDGAGLRERRRLRLARAISEAICIVAEPVTSGTG